MEEKLLINIADQLALMNRLLLNMEMQRLNVSRFTPREYNEELIRLNRRANDNYENLYRIIRMNRQNKSDETTCSLVL